MDPGYSLLQHIKTVPNLISEDPSVATPKNSSFMDLPWSEFSKLLAQKRRPSESSTHTEDSAASSTVTESHLGELSRQEHDALSVYEECIANRIASREMSFELIHLLHDITARFQNDNRYKNDPRYVRLWMAYASLLKNPMPIFQRLQDQRIGDELALFYCEVAQYHVKHQRMQEAKKMLQLGLSRGAQPVEILQQLLYQWQEGNNNNNNGPTSWHGIQQQQHPYMNETDGEEEEDTDTLPLHLPLPDILAWIDARIGHSARVAILQECYRYRQETSFEELRVKNGPPPSKKQRKVRQPQDRLTPACRSVAGVTFRDHVEQRKSKPLIVPLPLPPQLVRQKLADLPEPLPLQDLTSQNAKALRLSLERMSESTMTKSNKRQEQQQRMVVLGASSSFQVLGKLGEGGMARVYQVRPMQRQQDENISIAALKIETPANPWEFYILRQLAARLEEPNRVVAATDCFVYEDCSCLLLQYAGRRTLLDALNIQRQIHHAPGMPEPLAMLLAAELCQSLLAIHACGIIHGDLKLDNVMICPTVSDGWDQGRGHRHGCLPLLRLIDFGRAMDLTLFPPDVQLKATWKPDPTDAYLIQKGETWPAWMIDYWNTAAMVHWLLFGQVMNTIMVSTTTGSSSSTSNNNHNTEEQVQQRKIKLQQHFKRYWQRDTWELFFDCMLNPDPMPATEKIKTVVDMFEQHLRSEHAKTNSKLSMLVSQIQGTEGPSERHI
ncbi:protein kinase [Apophysomyces ossiformis]|uniref:Protein kinase n=1 Tax=Apophysomyces ossiformis TaxID=679940 RepID=A0A8H7BRD0_9FUNG|nr:protein kinase [Apophysomyces ossiformis]